MGRYPLGTATAELDRLRAQQAVWGGVTDAFLDRVDVRPGWRVADLGCGPGLLTESWLRRVGPDGEVWLVDEAERWHRHLEQTEHAADARVHRVRARLQDLELEPESYDLLFARWVFSFVPEPAACLRRLVRALRPGGLLAIEDYNHEGVSLYPESAGFRAAIRATRAMYADMGGDTFVGARLPALFRAAGLETVEIHPNVQAGGPDSPVFGWADAFFPLHADNLVERGVLTPEDKELFLVEWAERKADPDTLFFSPIVVDGLARRA